MLRHFIFMFLPSTSLPLSSKLLHPLLNISMDGGLKGEVVFRNSSYTRFLLFLDPTDVQYYFVKSVFSRNPVV